MQSNIPSCFYHPISILFLDDNKNFLDSLELEFGEDERMLIYTKVSEALKAINASCENLSKQIFHAIDGVELDTHASYPVNVEINKIHHMIYNPKRFDYIGISVVDYQMPEMTGLDFYEKIKHKNLCKVMLTAEGDKDLAIHALNDELIDKFLFKRSPTLHDDIRQCLKILKDKYFKKLSHSTLESLSDRIRNLLHNQDFIQLFDQVKNESKAVEYYLVDRCGSFLFLDENATPTWLIVRNAAELEKEALLVEGLDGDADLVNALHNKEQLLFFLSEDDYKKPMNTWKNQLFKAEKLNDEYYFSVVKNKKLDGIDWDKVKAYR